jgi:hypothetical protein
MILATDRPAFLTERQYAAPAVWIAGFTGKRDRT